MARTGKLTKQMMGFSGGKTFLGGKLRCFCWFSLLVEGCWVYMGTTTIESWCTSRYHQPNQSTPRWVACQVTNPRGIGPIGEKFTLRIFAYFNRWWSSTLNPTGRRALYSHSREFPESGVGWSSPKKELIDPMAHFWNYPLTLILDLFIYGDFFRILPWLNHRWTTVWENIAYLCQAS